MGMQRRSQAKSTKQLLCSLPKTLEPLTEHLRLTVPQVPEPRTGILQLSELLSWITCDPDSATLSSPRRHGEGIPGSATASPTISQTQQTQPCQYVLSVTRAALVRQHSSLSGRICFPGAGPLAGWKAFSF